MVGKANIATPVTVRTARELVSRLAEDHDLIAFSTAVSGRGSHFGRCNRWSRKKFEDALAIELAIADLAVSNCIFCAVEDEAKDLSEEQLQDISDLCMSELDRREHKFMKGSPAKKAQVLAEAVGSG